jgi:hypothetical protein
MLQNVYLCGGKAATLPDGQMASVRLVLADNR